MYCLDIVAKASFIAAPASQVALGAPAITKIAVIKSTHLLHCFQPQKASRNNTLPALSYNAMSLFPIVTILDVQKTKFDKNIF